MLAIHSAQYHTLQCWSNRVGENIALELEDTRDWQRPGNAIIAAKVASAGNNEIFFGRNKARLRGGIRVSDRAGSARRGGNEKRIAQSTSGRVRGPRPATRRARCSTTHETLPL
ncbi:hypothetical protein EVAR_57671_1 [Eumeta japonica]|uniref:Uncharacterized protein n=1 Tax=Eumeta variegata TaxID=151549 RepID=A0A4C1YPD8_EUMVA|nr:hypothetical protein EVAR_57671_1 [Eumeta japonica]